MPELYRADPPQKIWIFPINLILRLQVISLNFMSGPKNMVFWFSTVLSPIKATFIKTAIFLPEAIIKQLPGGRVRVKGSFNDAPFSLAVQHLKDGARYFAVSAPLRKAARIRTGDKVEVTFRLVDPDKLDIPEELEAVLAQDDLALKNWKLLTTGYQRSLIHYVTAVKNVDSRIKRSLKLMEKLNAGLWDVQKRKN